MAGLGVPVVLGTCAVLTLWFIVRDLDRPWVKSRVQAFSREQFGLGIDYEGVELSPTEGLRARSLRLLTPAALAAGSPDFVRVSDLELRAPLWRFAFGHRSLSSLRVGSVDVAVVRDESGRTTLTELFPPMAEAEPQPAARPSQLLSTLPSVRLDALEVGQVSARLVELQAGAAPRVSTLRGLALSGAVRAGEHTLEGTQLRALGAPLRIELSDGGRSSSAELQVDAGVQAADAASLALGVRVSLVRQDIAAGWPWQGELLALDANVRPDAPTGKTTLSVASLRVLGNVLALSAQADVFDADGLRAVTSGSAHVALDELPVAIDGVSLEGLALDIKAIELDWDGARVAGVIDWSGQLRGAALEQPEASARLGEVSVLGQGRFEPAGGRFQASLKAASAGATAAGVHAELNGATLELSGTTREQGSGLEVDADSSLAIASARLRAAAGQLVDVRSARLQVSASGSLAEWLARRFPRVVSTLTLASLEASDAAQRTRLRNVAAGAAVERLAWDASSELGVQGDAALSLSVPELRVLEGRATRATLAASGIELKSTLPLDLSRLAGTLTLASLQAGERSIESLQLELEAAEPLLWRTEREGTARAELRGGLGRFDVGGGTRGTLEGVSLVAQKLERDRYRLQLDVTGASLTLARSRVPGTLALQVRSDAAPAAGALSLATSLRGERGARLDSNLDAHFDRETGGLEYTLGLGAERLEAFAAMATEMDARAGNVQLLGTRLTASARGRFTGLLRPGGGALPTATEHPLGTAQGTQSARLELEGLDYRGAGRSLRIPKLELELASTHRAADGGRASARLQLGELRLEGGGTSLHLEDVDQKLSATFESAPDRGVVDVRSSLALGHAAQSWLPNLPVRRLSLSSNLQIDRLRSIFLRQLSLDNPASGSQLRAAGTLELLSPASQQGNKTIAGREALSFEGRLEQKLEPFELLGVASHARGSLALPFRVESGALLGYRLLAALEAKQVSFTQKDGSFSVEELNGTLPVLQEFALLDSGPVVGAGPRTSPLSDTRFFDVHPFVASNDFVTVRSLRLGGFAPLGPIAANVRLERADFFIDQLQAGYGGGQIVGQVHVAYRDGDPIARLRLNATGVRSGKSRDVFDANLALQFVPRAMTLDGKVQVVRASREHIEDILDVLDPFHESANANRVRQGLTLGYPKFVRFQLHDGAVDTKVELGGLAQLVRINEIRAVPLGPILQKYVAPSFAAYTRRGADSSPAPEPGADSGQSARQGASALEREARVER